MEKIYSTADPIESAAIEAVLKDNVIDYQIINNENVIFGNFPTVDFYVELHNKDKAILEIKTIIAADYIDSSTPIDDESLNNLLEQKYNEESRHVESLNSAFIAQMILSYKNIFAIGAVYFLAIFLDYLDIFGKYELLNNKLIYYSIFTVVILSVLLSVKVYVKYKTK